MEEDDFLPLQSAFHIQKVDRCSNFFGFSEQSECVHSLYHFQQLMRSLIFVIPLCVAMTLVWGGFTPCGSPRGSEYYSIRRNL